MAVHPTPARDQRPARAVATLMALALGGLGLMTLAGAWPGGHAPAQAARQVVLQATPAMWIGGLYLALAGLPLALWWRTPRAAAGWAMACMLAIGGCLAMAVRTHG